MMDGTMDECKSVENKKYMDEVGGTWINGWMDDMSKVHL